jgi:hypothetical protein
MAQSTCALGNATCLCTDAKFNALAEQCVETSCTVREVLGMPPSRTQPGASR